LTTLTSEQISSAFVGISARELAVRGLDDGIRSVADAARRAKSGIGQILRKSHGFKSYYVLDGGGGVGVAVMIFQDRESANAANPVHDDRGGLGSVRQMPLRGGYRHTPAQ
jgi:hypothetical protein